MAPLRTETGRREMIVRILSLGAIGARHTGVTITFAAVQVAENKDLWQPDL